MLNKLWKKLSGSSDDNAFIEINAPVEGNTVSIKTVSDPTFRNETLGKSAAIVPTVGKLVAPVDGEVTAVFKTGHAVCINADNGPELLLHIGRDTVQLKGQHFTIHCAKGDHVKKGDLLIEFDIEAIVAAGYEIVTPVIVCNSAEYSEIEVVTDTHVSPSDTIIRLKKA